MTVDQLIAALDAALPLEEGCSETEVFVGANAYEELGVGMDLEWIPAFRMRASTAERLAIALLKAARKERAQ